MPKPPSQKQLGYLKRLGYQGQSPTSSREASAAIDAMLATKDSAKAERALLKQRQQDERESKQRRKQELQAVKQEIAFMVRENKAYGGEGLFAGFRFVAIEDEVPSAEDEPYLGAFLPLQVAAKYPELLLRHTLDYEEVLSDDELRPGTKMVIAPGQFQLLSSGSGHAEGDAPFSFGDRPTTSQTAKRRSSCLGVILFFGAATFLTLVWVLA